MIHTISNISETNDMKIAPLLKCLTECNKGEELTVINVDVGYGQKRRLANLGVVPGAKIVKRKTAPFHGPLEINIKGTNLVIGRGLASKIFVRCGNSCPF
jgi:Fe2+ transport system protein FeoA